MENDSSQARPGFSFKLFESVVLSVEDIFIKFIVQVKFFQKPSFFCQLSGHFSQRQARMEGQDFGKKFLVSKHVLKVYLKLSR